MISNKSETEGIKSSKIDYPIIKLLQIYKSRKVLQKAFPEVSDGNLKRLLEWVLKSGLTTDSSKEDLLPYEDFYKKNISKKYSDGLKSKVHNILKVLSLHIPSNDILFRKCVQNRSLDATNLPLEVYIEITDACNLRCIMCREHPTLEGKFKHLNHELLNKVLPFLKVAHSIHPCGWGEPLMYPNYAHLLMQLREVNPHANLSFSSNGQLFNRELVNKIIDAKVNCITLSIDSAEPKTYEAIRRGASFEQLVRNIDMINEVKKARGVNKPELGIEVVIMTHNVGKLLELLEFAREKQMSQMVLEQVYGYPNLAVPNYEQYAEYFVQLRQRAAEYGIGLFGPFINQQIQYFYPSLDQEGGEKISESQVIAKQEDMTVSAAINKLSPMMCLQPWHTIYIRNTGKILTCCIAGPILGDLNENEFDEIWNGELYRKLRKSIVTGNYYTNCENCIRQKRVPNTIVRVKNKL